MNADVIVVGAGPAGIAAVCRLVAAGRSVTWVDSSTKAGGQIWRAGLPDAWARKLAAAQAQAGLRLLAGHAVIAAQGQELLLQDTLKPAAPALRISAPQILLALGARERFLPFPGWTLPGVHGAGGLQALAKNGWPLANKRVMLAGSGPLLLASAATALAAGASVVLIAEQAPRAALTRFAAGLPLQKMAQAAQLKWRLRKVPYRAGVWVVRALGERQLEAVELNDGRTIPCHALGIGFGLLPNTGLADLLGCRLQGQAIAVDAQQRTSQPGIYAAGECTGIGGVDKALIEGEIAATHMLGESDGPLQRQHGKAQAFAARLQSSFALRPELLQLADAKTLVCRCEDVTLGALKSQRSWRDAKLQTRCGMGACQGRICQPIARELFGWDDAGTPREPMQPAPIRSFLG